MFKFLFGDDVQGEWIVHGIVSNMRDGIQWDYELTETVSAYNRHDARLKALKMYRDTQQPPLDFCEWKRGASARRKG